MRDDSNNPSTPKPHDRFDPASLLISNPFAWEGVPESKSAASCGRTYRWGMRLSTGLDICVPTRCRTWWHQPCAEFLAETTLELIHYVVGSTGGAYFAVIKTSDLRENLISGRRYTKEKKLDRSVWYRQINREDGATFIIASDPLNGRYEPTVFHRVDDPVALAAGALALPGVIRVDGSRKGGDDRDGSDEDTVMFGAAGKVFHARVQRLAADIARERYGVDVNPLAGAAADGPITSKQWAVCMEEAWVKERAKAQRSHR
jgi:hypothetical protein